MINMESKKNNEKICNLGYLNEIMGGKKNLMIGIIEVFLKQVPEELHSINDAIEKIDFLAIKNIAHTMRSSVSIMGISVLSPVLKELETLGSIGSDNSTSAPGISGRLNTNIDKIKELNQKLNLICHQAIDEIESEKLNYV